MFNEELLQQILKSEFAGDNTCVKGDYINKLICPKCGSQEAWAYAKKPLSIICNRQNECGAKTNTVKLFNIYEHIEQKFPKTKSEPHRPAKAYLESRGIPTAIIDRIEFEYWPKARKDCGGCVMFPVGKDEGKTLYNGCLFNPPAGEGKSHNVGHISGHYWEMPGHDYDSGKPTYVTEGILNALSLIAMVLQAIAILGAGFEPSKFNLSKFKNLVFSFDNDPAGAKAVRKWKAHFKKIGKKEEFSAIIPIKGDWNDLIVNVATPEKAKERFDENYDRYKLQADLALSDTAQEYAMTYAKGNNGFAPGLFTFNGCYYWSWKNKDDEVQTMRASNFTVSVEHFQRSDKDIELPVFQYRLKIKPQKGRSVAVTATGNDLKSVDGLVGFFLRHGKVLWCGSIEAARACTEMVLKSGPPEVRQAKIIGYDHSSKFHVLKDIRVVAQ